MLIGEYQHNMDIKGRVFIPAKLREDLGDSFIVTKGLDNCLFLYSLTEWQRIEEKIKQIPLSSARGLQRFLFSGAENVEVDKQGRVVIPQKLRVFANLERESVIIGASTRAEIWNPENWESACSDLTTDAIALAMEQLGF